MRHFDALTNTSIYEKMDQETKDNLRTAYDVLVSDTTGLGNDTCFMSDKNDDRIRISADNIAANYERFMYIQEEVELMADFLDIPLDRVAFFRTTMNLIARTVRHTTKIWK